MRSEGIIKPLDGVPEWLSEIDASILTDPYCIVAWKTTLYLVQSLWGGLVPFAIPDEYLDLTDLDGGVQKSAFLESLW